ncbi:hypothetical protein ACWGCW_12860 [Streptomyces sp. NPDC054933]
MLLDLQIVGQWLRRLPRRPERSTHSGCPSGVERASFLDVTLGADVLFSLTVMLVVLLGDVAVSAKTAVAVAAATAAAARSYIRYQRVRVR